MYTMYSTGRYTVSTLVLEHFALDGGAMFGAVPKSLWNKQIRADDLNRIPLCTRVLIVDGPEGRILVDCGNGDGWTEKEQKIYDIRPLSPLPIRERVLGVQHVILTHLHFDHAGGAVFVGQEGRRMLSYPKSPHYLQESNLERALHPGPRERGSYLSDTVSCVAQSDLRLLSDGEEIFPGISVHRSDGHTRGLQWILIRDTCDIVAYPSDLVPTAHHVHIPWLMGYDLHAERTMEEKGFFLERAYSENWLVVFEHDRDTTCGRIRRTAEGRYVLSADPVLS